MIVIPEYSDKTKMLMQLYYSCLSEKDRRHYAAVEAIKLGHGGTTYISRVLAVDRNTIIQGKKELMALAEHPQIPEDKQRRAEVDLMRCRRCKLLQTFYIQT